MRYQYLFLAILSLSCGLGHAAWTPPVTISGSASALHPLGGISIDTHSNTTVGWLIGSGPGTGHQLFTATLSPGSLIWDPAELLFSDIDPFFPAYPIIVTDMRDEQMALWGELDPVNLNLFIYSSCRSPGTIGWPSPVATILPGIPSGGNGGSPGNLGNASGIVALTSTFLPPYNIFATNLPVNATAWLDRVFLGQDNSPQPTLGLSVREAKTVMGWKTNIPSLTLHTLQYLFPTATFIELSDIPLPTGTTDLLTIYFSFDESFNSIAFFTTTNGTSSFAYFSMLDSLQTIWPSPVLVSNPANSAYALSLASSTSGTTFLLWSEKDSLDNGYIFAGELSVNGVLSGITQLSGPIASFTNIDPSSNIAVDAQGNAIAAWSYLAGGDSTVQMSSKAVGGSWDAPTTFSSTGQSAKAVVSDQGTAVVVWTDSVTGSLFSSINLDLFDLKPPTNFIGKVVHYRSLHSSNYALKMTWDADPIRNIATYEIYNGLVLVATIPSNIPLEYLTEIPNSSSTGNYTIKAIASNGNVSAAVPLTIIP